MNVVNGSLPASLLVEVEPGLSLEPATAEAYRRMKAAAAQDGVTLAIPRPAGAYRSLFVQKDMRERGWLYNLDPTSSVALAAPGYSTHGLGDRVDIVRGAAGDWAIRNAERFGFVREFGAADPRHFRFTKPTWAASAVIPIESEEDDMPHFDLIKTPDGTVWWCVNRVSRYAIPNGDALTTYQAFAREFTGSELPIRDKSHAQILAYGAPVYASPIVASSDTPAILAAIQALPAAIRADLKSAL